MEEKQQQIADVFANVSSGARRYSAIVSEYVDERFDRVAEILREHLADATWLPEPIRAHLPQRSSSIAAQGASDSLVLGADGASGGSFTAAAIYERVEDWVLRHKVFATLLAVVTGTVSYKVLARAISARKFRRARRIRNGARCEVVILAASPSLPVTQSVALDLERRGFVVYVVSGSAEEETAVKQMARPDIRPLSIDITDTATASAALDRFALYLHAPHAAVPGARRSMLTLTGIVLIPSLDYQTSPIATIPPSSFADLFNTHLLHPILTIQAFLPLLTARTALQPGEKPSSLLETASSLSNFSHLSSLSLAALGKPSTEKATPPSPPPSPPPPPPPKVLVFTPSIISSVNPPFHAPESTVCSALSAFTEVLAAELRPLNIPVTHIQLGTFDFSSFAPSRSVTASYRSLSSTGRHMSPSEPLSWSEPARRVYGRNFAAQSESVLGSGRAIRGLRGTAIRDLHHAVFDVLDGSNTNAVVRVGLGADLYGFVGAFMPRGLVAWMMGVRKVDDLSSWYQQQQAAAAAASGSSSSSNSSSSSTETTPGRRGKRVTSSELEAMADSHVWR